MQNIKIARRNAAKQLNNGAPNGCTDAGAAPVAPKTPNKTMNGPVAAKLPGKNRGGTCEKENSHGYVQDYVYGFGRDDARTDRAGLLFRLRHTA